VDADISLDQEKKNIVTLSNLESFQYVYSNDSLIRLSIDIGVLNGPTWLEKFLLLFKKLKITLVDQDGTEIWYYRMRVEYINC